MENNFEKNVQKKLEKLRVEPSQSVWTQIDRKLQKRKVRKVVIWWFAFPVILFLGLGIYYYELHHPAISLPSPASNSHTTAPALNPATTGSAGDTGNSSRNNFKDESAGEETPIKKQTLTGDQSVLNSSAEGAVQRRNSKDVFHRLPEKIQQEQPDFTEAQPDYPGLATQITGQNLIPLHLPVFGSLHPKILNPELNFTPSTLIDVAKKPNWKVELVFIPGGGFLSSQGKVFNSPAYNMPSTGSVTDPGNLYQNFPQKPSFSGGFAFKFGLKAKKAINSKTDFSVGLQYSQTNIQQSMTYISGANRNITTEHFGNIFRFIELPVTLNLKTKIGSVNTRWEIGAGLSQLINTNALQYSNNNFYKDNSLFRHTQFGLHGGISFSIIENSLISLGVGPFYQYNLTDFAKGGIFENHHLNFAGVKTEISLPRKK